VLLAGAVMCCNALGSMATISSRDTAHRGCAPTDPGKRCSDEPWSNCRAKVKGTCSHYLSGMQETSSPGMMLFYQLNRFRLVGPRVREMLAWHLHTLTSDIRLTRSRQSAGEGVQPIMAT
jgi:hypothetical protein